MLPEPPAELVDTLRAGRAVAVVGSGLSCAAGYPSWTELLQGICDESLRLCPQHRRTIATDVPVVARPTLSHRQLMQLGLTSIVVTTNYDSLLEDAAPVRPAVYSWSDRGVPDQIARGVPLVLKLHGDAAHPRDIILAREQYTGEQFMSATRSAVGALLATSRPLWIGYGHSDPDLDLLLDTARALGVSGGFAVVSNPNPILLSRLRSAQIFAIVLSSHGDLPRFLQRLALAADRTTIFPIKLRTPWSDDRKATSQSISLGDRLYESGLDARPWNACSGVDDLIYEAPAGHVNLLDGRLQENCHSLLRLLREFGVVECNWRPVTLPPVAPPANTDTPTPGPTPATGPVTRPAPSEPTVPVPQRGPGTSRGLRAIVARSINGNVPGAVPRPPSSPTAPAHRPLLGNDMLIAVTAGLARLDYPEHLKARVLAIVPQLTPPDIDLLIRYVTEGVGYWKIAPQGDEEVFTRIVVQEDNVLRFMLGDTELSEPLDSAAYNALKRHDLIMDFILHKPGPARKPTELPGGPPPSKHAPFRLQWKFGIQSKMLVEAVTGYSLRQLLESKVGPPITQTTTNEMNHPKTILSRRVMYAVAKELGEAIYSHAKINALFTGGGAPGDAPDGNLQTKIVAWFKRCNDAPDVDVYKLLGVILEEIFERPEHAERAEKIRSILADENLRYKDGRVVLQAS